MSDWVIAAVSATTSITTPTGWTSLGAAAGTPPLELFIRQPTPGSTSFPFTFSGANGGGVLAEFAGLSGIAGSADGLVNHSSTGTSFTATAGTPVAAGELAIVALAIQDTATGSGLATSTVPSGWFLGGAQPDAASTDNGIAVFLYWQVGTGVAPSAALSWTVTGGTAYSTTITSIK